MIHIPPEVQTAAGIPAAQTLQCSFSGFFLYIKGQARKMNQKIREKQQDE